MGLGWFSCHQGKPDGRRFFWVSDLSLQPGPHLAGSDIDLSQDTQRGQTGWPQPCHSRSRPPPNTIITDTRQSPFPLTGGLLSPPHSPSLPGAESLGSCCLLGLESERRGEEASAECCGCRPLWSIWTIFTRSREALWGDWDGLVPQTSVLTFWAALAVHTAKWASLDLGFCWPHFWVAESFFGWLTPVMTRPESCVLSQGAFSSFSVLGCACRAT